MPWPSSIRAGSALEGEDRDREFLPLVLRPGENLAVRMRQEGYSLLGIPGEIKSEYPGEIVGIGNTGSPAPIAQESVVAGARNTRFLRLIEREIPRLVA
jgi:hypothetical protein